MHVRTKLPMAFEGKLYFAMVVTQLPVLSKCQLVCVRGSGGGGFVSGLTGKPPPPCISLMRPHTCIICVLYI